MNNNTTTLQVKPEGENLSMQAQVKEEKQERLVQELSSEKGNKTIENPRDSILQAKPEGENLSMQAQLKTKTQDNLLQELSSEQGEINVNPRNSVDFDTYIRTNPDFRHYNFSTEDIDYLKTLDESLMQKDSSFLKDFKNLSQIAGEIPEDLVAFAFSYVIPRVVNLKNIN